VLQSGNVNGALRVNNSGWRLQQYCGQFSDLVTLRLALERGLLANYHTMQGAAESGSLDKVRWLYEVQKTVLPASIGKYAAKGGNLELLTWLTEEGCTFDQYACIKAAAAGHEHVLRYLREQSCEWDARTTAAAAENGHVSLVQWLIGSGCPFDAAGLCESAAKSGSVEMMVYARQQRGCVLNARVMRVAAERGRLSTCQYLHSEGCAWDTAAPKWAAYFFLEKQRRCAGCLSTAVRAKLRMSALKQQREGA
jgi:Ankyrin repeats (3 copies)